MKQTFFSEWRNYTLVYAIVIVSFISTAWLSLLIQSAENQKRVESFQTASEECIDLFEKEFNAHIAALDAVIAFYHSSQYVDLEEFRTFTQLILRNYPHIQALEWIPRVRSAERDTFEKKAQQVYPGYVITERNEEGAVIKAQVREDYFPVYYLEPFEGNKGALGFDLNSNERRSSALKKAWESGEITATAPIQLVQTKTAYSSVLFLGPVYDEEADLKSGERNQELLKGFVLSVLDVDTALEDILAVRNKGINVSLNDVTNPEQIHCLYTPDIEPIDSELSKRKKISIAGRTWEATAFAMPGYYYERFSLLAIGVLFLGLLVSAFLIVHTFLMIRQKNTLEDNAKKNMLELAESEERYHLAVKGSSVGLWDWNVKTNALYWSPAFKNIVGITDEGFVPHLSAFEERLHPEDHDAIMEALKRHLSERAPYDVEYRLKQESGNYVWIHARGQATWDDAGNALRMAGSVDDISERKLATSQLKQSHDQLRDLSLKLQTIQEQERRNISREIHDQLGQLLTGFKVELSWLKARCDEHPDHREVVDRLFGDCNEMIRKVRELATELRPSLLDDFGFSSAMEWQVEKFEEKTGIYCLYESDLEERLLDNACATAFYRISQEALTNVIRHAEASSVKISLLRNGKSVELIIADDGKGALPDVFEHSKSLGVLGMRERIVPFGGEINFYSKVGEGTKIVVSLPTHAIHSQSRKEDYVRGVDS